MHKSATKSAKLLTPEQLANLKKNAYGILSEARKTLLTRFPFYGSIAMSLELIPTRDKRIDTACTDGKSIYFDIDFLSTLSNDDKVFVLAHEVMHNVMLHLLRTDKKADHYTLNLAEDMEVNNILAKDGLSVPKNAVTSRSYNFADGLNAETYYELLMEQKQNKQNNAFGDNTGDGDDGDDNSSSSSQQGLDKEQFDKHIHKDEELADVEDEIQDKYGKLEYDPDFQPKVTQANVEHVRESAVAAAQMLERTAGSVPAHLKKLIDDLLTPTVNWRDVLAKYVLKTAGESQRSWNSPNRRFAGRGLYLPSSHGDAINIIVGIDTSGSVEDYSKQFLSELNGLISSYDNYNVTVIQCDSEVQKVDEYNTDNPLDTASFEFHGYGGTVLSPIFKYVEDNQIEGDCIVILTDGEVCDNFKPEDQPYLPVLWCVTKDGTDKYLPFGEICHIDN